MESLWIDFYQRGYIELEDVINLQKWLQVLCDIGYIFPNLIGSENSKHPIENDLTISDNNLFVDDSVITTAYQQSKDFLMGSKKFACQNEEYSVTFGNSDIHEGCRSYIASAIGYFKYGVSWLT